MFLLEETMRFEDFSIDGTPELSFSFTAGDTSSFDDIWKYKSLIQFPCVLLSLIWMEIYGLSVEGFIIR